MNPTNVEAFEFSLFYEYTENLSDPTPLWQSTRYVLGEGQEGLDQANAQLANINAAIDAGYVTNVRNCSVKYASIQVWTEWQQDSGQLTN